MGYHTGGQPLGYGNESKPRAPATFRVHRSEFGALVNRKPVKNQTKRGVRRDVLGRTSE
jgi:hypothetical protein